MDRNRGNNQLIGTFSQGKFHKYVFQKHARSPFLKAEQSKPSETKTGQIKNENSFPRTHTRKGNSINVSKLHVDRLICSIHSNGCRFCATANDHTVPLFSSPWQVIFESATLPTHNRWVLLALQFEKKSRKIGRLHRRNSRNSHCWVCVKTQLWYVRDRAHENPRISRPKIADYILHVASSVGRSVGTSASIIFNSTHAFGFR